MKKLLLLALLVVGCEETTTEPEPEDCAGVVGGTATLDDCGVCGGDGSSCGLNGDVNGDGFLNVLDVVVIVNIVLGGSEPIDAGDLNGDGLINVLDVVFLVNIILQG